MNPISEKYTLIAASFDDNTWRRNKDSIEARYMGSAFCVMAHRGIWFIRTEKAIDVVRNLQTHLRDCGIHFVSVTCDPSAYPFPLIVDPAPKRGDALYKMLKEMSVEAKGAQSN